MELRQYLLFILIINIPFARGSYFDASLLDIGNSKTVDLSLFEKGLNLLPGNYKVSITLNNNPLGVKNLYFNIKDNKENEGLFVCMDKKQLESLGLKKHIIDKFNTTQKCYFLGDYIDGVREDFLVETHQLVLNIPQIYVDEKPQGSSDPSEWNEGINAVSLNYQFNGVNGESNGVRQNKGFMNIIDGFNISSWRVRNYFTYNSSAEDGKEWESVYTYAQKSIAPINSQLIMGEVVSASELFDSVNFSGVSLFTDDNMLPDSRRGFAPVVRGVAKTNATIEVRQNGFLIYQKGVSAGPFEITDLYPSSYSGDLQVTVVEENKETYTYSVPYSTIPIFQREGTVKYNMDVGWLRGKEYNDKENFFETTGYLGLKYGSTIYGGMQLTSNYKAFAVGFGKNLGRLGAASLDVTYANSEQKPKKNSTGQSIRFLYSKSLNNYGTNFQIFGYRYSTEDFYTLRESGALAKKDENIDLRSYYSNKKSSINATISQTFGDMGSIYINASRKNYWGRREPENNIQIGYSGFVGLINYNLNMNIEQDINSRDLNKSFSLNLSLPMSSGRGYISSATSYDSNGRINGSVGLNGTILDNDNLGYSLHQGYGDNGASGQINGSYQGSYINSYAGYSYNESNKQITYGVNGSSIIHADGVTLGSFMGNTSVLVEAKGASGVTIQNTQGIKIDKNGYAIVPNASEFRRNRIALETSTFPANLDIEQSILEVSPTKGAIVKAVFKTQVGSRVLFNLSYKNKLLPFGTLVSFVGEKSITGIVDEEGRVYMSGMPESGSLSFESENGNRCVLPYKIRSMDSASVQKITLNCSDS